MRKVFIITCCVICFAVSALAQFEAPDPSRNIPNARVLAMGRAYMGLSDDTAAIFCNPAGLANVSGWDLTNMSGKFLDEFSYLSFSGLYATDVGVWGLGFMSSSISGAFATMRDPDSSDEDPLYIIDPAQPPINYFNNVYILSYGDKLSKFLRRFGWEDKISLGANLKLFATGLSGDGIAEGEGTGSGTELDLGIMYEPPWPWLSAGLTLQNVLTSSMGGKLHYQSGHDESYPAVVEFGGALNVLGQKDALYKMGEQEFKFLLDYYFHPTLLSNLPPTFHTGFEYKPIPMIAIRMGIDQDISGDGAGTAVTTVNNFTGGVGLKIGGFRFDYAYHQFAGITEVSNNYFSLSYGLMPEEAMKPIQMEKPKDKLITFDESIEIKGKAISPKVRQVKANNIKTKMDLRGEFLGRLKLKEGKNVIQITGLDADNKEVDKFKLRALKLKVFPDVKKSYWVAQPISLLAMQDIISGYPDGTFRPEGNITRAEMCALLMKTKGRGKREGGRGTIFMDVAENHWAAQFIAQAAELGVVKGYEDGTFKPKNNITRAEGVTMIARFAGISEEAYTDQFMDVNAFHWAAKIISAAEKAGILEYLKGKGFVANRLLTRAETVEMLYRTQVVKEILEKGILNWEVY